MRIRKTRPGVGIGLFKFIGALRVGHLAAVFQGSAPNLLSAPVAALRRNDLGGGKRGGGIPAHGANHSAASFAAARSSPATKDQRTRSRGGPGKIGSADGSDLGTALPLTAESPFRQPPVKRAGGSIYVPELPRLGSDELASRTGHPPDGGDPQSLGWQSNLARSAYPRYSGQHSANLPAATPLRFFYSSKADLCFSAQAFGLNCPYALNNYPSVSLLEVKEGSKMKNRSAEVCVAHWMRSRVKRSRPAQ